MELSESIMWLSRPPRPGSSSRYKGVYWDTRKRRWRVVVRWQGVRHELGLFKDDVEAARAYDTALLEIVGPEIAPRIMTNQRMGLFEKYAGVPPAECYDTSRPRNGHSGRLNDPDARKRLSDNIFRLRRERGWTQNEVGVRLGLKDGVYIGHLEQEIRSPGVTMRSQLAAVFGITEDELTK